LINATFVVRDDAGQPAYALQRLHRVFAPEVNLDLEAVTAHLAARGLVTPRLVRTRDDAAWLSTAEGTWRALTWLDGETVHRVPAPSWAETGGVLIGQFHRAVADLEYDYRFVRAGVHDTARHLGRLASCVQQAAQQDRARRSPEELEASELARDILATAARLPAMPDLPRRHVHGDLKISNVLFQREPLRALALVDLDTLGKGTLAFELGDAMRSWCNPAGEDAHDIRFELPIFAAAIGGFRSVGGSLATREELASVVIGLETVCVELAARFCVDVFDDNYFGWDAARFPSRRAHNLIRARGQLTLGLSVRAARSDALAIVSG
jgi:Ser/Thr protein kinase RdoA (MazF antagonist)